MMKLKEDAVCIVNSFFCDSILTILNIFIALLKQTYNDASCEDTVMTKLKIFRKKNREFMSFYPEFLDLTHELD